MKKPAFPCPEHSRSYRFSGALLLGMILLSVNGIALALENNGPGTGGASTRAACSLRCDTKYVVNGDQRRPDERARYARCLANCKRTYPH
jgi:hypothetical protein